MRDLLYAFDKINYNRYELGEIQSDFNMSNVIDGTKDSSKVIAINYIETEITPMTILYHVATMSWWVVSHDKVEKIVDDEGYIYKHNLELLGAIELLNARDLTDCGFNQNTYTIEQFIKRLFSLSSFDIGQAVYINDNGVIDLNKNVDYVKTFENYTPLSALREFLDAYNCSVKLSFSTTTSSGVTTIQNTYVDIISKTGNTNKQPHNESIFNNVQEIKTMDKNSYGTIVVSNAQNVISTKSKTYPSSGIVRPTGTSWTFNGRNGTMVVRLPSPAYKVNWVDMVNTKTPVSFLGAGGEVEAFSYFNPYDDDSVNSAYNNLKQKAEQHGSEVLQRFLQDVKIEDLKKVGFRRFYYEDKYNPTTGLFVSSNYIPLRSAVNLTENLQTVLSNKEMKDNVSVSDNVFYCDRGSDIIEGINFFGDSGDSNGKITFSPHDERVLMYFNSLYVVVGDHQYVSQSARVDMVNQLYDIRHMGFVVNYIPMSDIKIKLDNSGYSKDIQLYNQNGKLTDSVALSKSLLSYAKEIESDNITKYGTYYYEFSTLGGYPHITTNMPSVGDLVIINNQHYVINNASMNFVKSENDLDDLKVSYQVQCEFTLSKNIAVKSLMVNPNTNIRDYGIPQNFNVKRKQLYRDFFELTYVRESTSSSGRLKLSSVLGLDYKPQQYKEHNAIIRVTFANDNVWYFQLATTTFALKKSIYEIVDFKDNNIIGYGSINTFSGFDISRLLSGLNEMINTPISYVDDEGKVKGFRILFPTNEQLTSVYNYYKGYHQITNDQFNAFCTCFIPSDIYTFANARGKGTSGTDGYEFDITESDYYKDATEVPVFEYACQLDDSDSVIIGSDIFDTNDDIDGYVYSFVKVAKGSANENNFTFANVNTPFMQGNVVSVKNGVVFEYDNDRRIIVKIYDNVSIDISNGNKQLGNQLTFDNDYDYVIVRHHIKKGDEVLGELAYNTIFELVNMPTPTENDLGKFIVVNAGLGLGSSVFKCIDNQGNYEWNLFLISALGTKYVYQGNYYVYLTGHLYDFGPYQANTYNTKLMFIFKDLESISDLDDELTLQINYYSTN